MKSEKVFRFENRLLITSVQKGKPVLVRSLQIVTFASDRYYLILRKLLQCFTDGLDVCLSFLRHCRR